MHWTIHAAWAGLETAHLHPFRPKLHRACQLAELKTADARDIGERYNQWPLIEGYRAAGGVTSADGLHHWYHADR